MITLSATNHFALFLPSDGRFVLSSLNGSQMFALHSAEIRV